eukprot:g17011.t1
MTRELDTRSVAELRAELEETFARLREDLQGQLWNYYGALRDPASALKERVDQLEEKMEECPAAFLAPTFAAQICSNVSWCSTSFRMWRLFLTLFARGYSDNFSCASTGGLGLLQKSPSVQRLTVEVESIDREWVAVDGGADRACRGKSAGDNLASYFTVNSGLASLSACQALCEGTANCQGVEFHTSGRCEVWTRPGGIEASISLDLRGDGWQHFFGTVNRPIWAYGFVMVFIPSGLSGYSCYAYALSDFIPADDGSNRACRGDTANDDQASYYQVTSVSSLGECKELCRSNVACRGVEFSGSRCERPKECKQACRLHSGCQGIEHSGSRCEIWTRPEGIQATVTLTGFKCYAYQGSGVSTTTTPAPEGSAAEKASSLCKEWVGYTFQKRDEGKAVKVSNNQIFVDGLRRTDIDPNYAGNGLDAPKVCSNDPPEYWQTRGMTCETFDPDTKKRIHERSSCKLLPGCLPVGMASVQVPLTAATFATFFSVGGRYVYAIKGLRTSTNPCNRRSRWRKLDCASESCSATSLLANDLAAIQAELTAASAQGWLRDVDVECGEVAAGVVVEVGSEHFQHVHLDEFNALYAEDQLRQRTAWALSQIFVLAVVGGSFEGRTEMWLNYYDIFIRNAFGTYRDILREVTYNPIMGDYLTFKRNRAFDESNNYPDENFAREIMQLFSIGLWKLNPDGTRKKDASGLDIPTYTNEHIMNFARVFTGFDEQADRDNVEYVQNHNFIDPMRVNARWHDVYPKPDLDGNFLGDGYPLCSDLPPGYFLLQGAKFEFLGHNYGGSDVLSLDSSSQLFAKLCGSGSSAWTTR